MSPRASTGATGAERLASRSSSKVECLYKVLGIAESANEMEIKKAYRRLALKWHPDKNTDGNTERAERMFKRIAQAYEVLSDSKRRAEYDRCGSMSHNPPPNTGRSRRRQTTAFTSADFLFRSPFDVFRDFFGDPFKGFDSPFDSPLFRPQFTFFSDLGAQDFEDSFLYRRRRSAPRTSIFNHSTGSSSFDFSTPSSSFDESDCEFSSTIRFSAGRKPGKFMKTTTCTRMVDGKKVITKTVEDDGDEMVEVSVDGILKSKSMNGSPIEISVL